MRFLGTMVLLACAGAAWAAGPPDAEAWARFGKIEEARRLSLRGFGLYQAGQGHGGDGGHCGGAGDA